MRKILVLILITLGPHTITAQKSELTFPASQLKDMALRYTGDALNWPIIVKLAERNLQENTFILSEADLVMLENLSNATAIILEQKERLTKAIKNGATIFAKQEWMAVEQQFNLQKEAVKNGDIETAISVAATLPEKINALELALEENRMVEVQAQLEDKIGTVDKRSGLLGEWVEAIIGDFFKEADGLKTYEESFANLGFTDGTKIIIDPNTTAIIRKSRVDKLNETSDTEITLQAGGLLARLTASAAERSNYVLSAGSSQSELRTTNFYAESDGEETVKLANYDGVANISANDVTVTIGQNEGTIVREGEPPSPPIKLLPAPQLVWESTDTVIYTNQLLFAFHEVDGAESYVVQRSTSSSFDSNIQEIKTTNNVTPLYELSLGTTYVRVLAVDNLGLRGPYSDPVRVIRNEDNQPPPAFVDNLNGNILFTLRPSITITGVTEPDAKITINGTQVTVQKSGRFSYPLKNLNEDQTISLVASDGSGNRTVRDIRIVYLTEEILLNFALSGARMHNNIIVERPLVTISSTAYPGLEVHINNAGTMRRVQTDSHGRWGITMNMQEGELSVTFKDIRTGETYLNKSFTVQAN